MNIRHESFAFINQEVGPDAEDIKLMGFHTAGAGDLLDTLPILPDTAAYTEESRDKRHRKSPNTCDWFSCLKSRLPLASLIIQLPKFPLTTTHLKEERRLGEERRNILKLIVNKE